ITSEAYSKCLQDNIVTMRNGRYVIPVKIEHKSAIKGLVHDTSSSGATVFIEPLSVVEQNNALRELEIAEAKEIERILYTLSASVSNFSEQLRLDYYNVTQLAVIFAKAELSWRMNATEPSVSKNGPIVLMGARHPLLKTNKIVPTDIRLGDDFDSLIITGPNTGGKTVALKTLGLLTLMAQYGLHIPARDGSRIRVFKSVYADIGDEQSIEQSLSTFSAHMTNIVSILKHADSESLVLFDELGAGTDPVEGAALAVAIIENVRERGSLVAATTHYAEMKIYALETKGVCNAACEFDVTTLAPTYRLIIGAPGKSNAFAISARLGLPDDIINAAGKLVDGDNKRFERVIEKLEKERIEAEKRRAEAEEIKREYERKYSKAESEIKEKLENARKTAEKAQAEAAAILERARITQEFVFAELDKAKKAKERADAAEAMENARGAIRRKLKESDEVVNPVNELKNDKNYVLPRDLRAGDEVIIINLGRRGTLLDKPDAQGNVTVQTGMINTRTNIKNLRLCEDAEVKAKTPEARSIQNEARASVAMSFKSELDLRGMNSDEAWEATDKYLDNATLIGVKSVRIIHGKGTGVLRRTIWERLKADKRVKDFRLGVYGEGDGGVTVAELK
ncbi:MAG: endonuclease MutS2, partial [Clostridia bacterium]|nr:endonuclease MutS2 [Clostridia bacterium]